MHTGFRRRNLRERDHLEGPGIEESIIFKCIFIKWVVGVWNGSIWLNVVTNLRVQ